MSGRRGGRIGVDRYPRTSVAQGVWRLNEAHFESRFNSWPVIFYPGFVTPAPQFQLRMTTNPIFELATKAGLTFTSKGLTVFSQTYEFLDYTEKPSVFFTFKALPVFLTSYGFSNTLPTVTMTSGTLS